MKTTNDELNRYDRQIRAWGFETQRRLHSCKFLFIGVCDASLECAKNIILAGASVVHLSDSENIIHSDFSSRLDFLVKLNPLCPTDILPESVFINNNENEVNSEELNKYDFICLFNKSDEFVSKILSLKKITLVFKGITGDIVYLNQSCLFSVDQQKVTKIDALEQTILGSLLSQMVVDHLPPLEQPIHHRLVFNPENLSASVQLINE